MHARQNKPVLELALRMAHAVHVLQHFERGIMLAYRAKPLSTVQGSTNERTNAENELGIFPSDTPRRHSASRHLGQPHLNTSMR